MWNNRILLFIVLMFNAALSSQTLNNSGVSVVTNTSIFKTGTFGACHASTITEILHGEFLAAWFAGSYEGADNVGIWISTLKNNKWSTPVEIAIGRDSTNKQIACWNPVLFRTKDNTIILFYKVGANPREWQGYFIKSADYAQKWTKPQKLPDGFLGPIKDKPIQLTNGKILCPSSTESENGSWRIHLEITNEELDKWEKINIKSDTNIGIIQPTILKHPDGRLQLLCRSRQNSIYQTWSSDSGLSWSEPKKTMIPNPNSGIDAVSLAHGGFVLVYNPLLHGKEWYNGRNVLYVAESADGFTWKDIYQLEMHKSGEYSYPAVIQASDGYIHITYTYDRKTIKYVVLKLKDTGK